MLISVPNALVLSGDLFGERHTGGGRPAMELRGNPMPIRSGLIALSALLCASTASAEGLQWRPSEARTIGAVIWRDRKGGGQGERGVGAEGRGGGSEH